MSRILHHRQRTASTIPHQNAVSDVHNQAMTTIRSKTANLPATTAAERANRCAEVRLRNTKKHIDFMQHLDFVKLKRQRVEMMDRLERFKKNLIKIQASKADLLKREQAKMWRYSEDVRGDICFPISSEHSPRFRGGYSQRHPSHHMPVQSQPFTDPGPKLMNRHIRRPASVLTPTMNRRDSLFLEDVDNRSLRSSGPYGFGRKLSVIEESPILHDLNGNPALRVMSLRQWSH